MQSVCRTGRPEFKRDMGRNTDAIKECLQFKGEPDPLRGDEIYRRVREMAKETLEAIFDSQAPVTTSAVAPRISGQGHIVVHDHIPQLQQVTQVRCSDIFCLLGCYHLHFAVDG